MFKYALKRIVWMVPTLFGITVVCFVVINLAPGGPVEQLLNKMRFYSPAVSSQGVSDEVIAAVTQQYGFDQPVYARYWLWLKNIVSFNFGESFRHHRPAIDVIAEKLPVTLQFGILSLVLIYFISVPLGIAKAVRDGSRFDLWTSVTLMIAYAVPPLILGVLLRVYLAGGHGLDIFPLGDLYSDNYSEMGFWSKVSDRFMHLVLPLICYVANGFTVLVFLMKNSMLEEIKLEYIRTARAKGLSERMVIYKHALRNALVPMVTGLGSFLTLYLAGSIVIEQIFNLDGMGLLSYESILNRDYNVIMALIFFESVLAMLSRLFSDLAFFYIDPRIDFQRG